MKLYKVLKTVANSIKTFKNAEYVVANSLIEVATEFPEAEEIHLVSEDVKIINNLTY
jgi:hypothetical protein